MILLVFSIISIIICLSACSNHTESIPMQENEIRLTCKIISSRVVDPNLQSTQIVKGQKVGITIEGANREHQNIAWTVGDNGVLTNSGNKIYWEDEDINIIAYHPWADAINEFSVSTDQSKEENYLNSDLLWTSTTASIIDVPVSLAFRHKLAKINITLRSEDIADLSNAVISICGTNIKTDFDPATGELSDAATDDIQDIIASITTSTAYTASCIVIPQKIKSGTKFLKITHADTEYYYTLPTDIEFKSGFSYNYTLYVEKTLVKLVFNNITDWKAEEMKGDAEETFSGDTPYLTFTADAEQSLTLSRAVETLEYSVDDEEWETLGTKRVIFGGEKGNLRLRGKSAAGTGVTKPQTGVAYFGATVTFGNMDVPVACKGDIRTLIDWSNYSTVDTSNARFYNLFKGCKNLVSAPSLPITTLASYCYSNMFEDCINLKTPPQLPSMELKSDCYYAMFRGCTSLTVAPELPATDLIYSCYERMFEGCTSITSAPELKSENISWSCYERMFKDCTSLQTPPELPAKTMQVYCYCSMFEGCINLTTVPELPAETLATRCYESMFKGCVKLQTPPALPAKIIEEACYNSMFEGCTNLKTAPELPGKELDKMCYYSMFEGCTSLTKAPTNLPATKLYSDCYYKMFYGCTSLTTAPELPAKTLAFCCYGSMFNGCTSLTTAPALPATTLAGACYSRMFYGCTSLTTAPELHVATLVDRCYIYMFSGCQKLNNITMLATNVDASQCLDNWVEGVSSTGTFTKAQEMTTLSQGVSGIPKGWTIKNK